ncbi:hypothetical protein [Lysinibacillus capsici]|uniref:hypothetical protein n=1 Tax=Lysinibacillus capsici TaxID=2115968 RepID=UPI002A7EB31C|nr:hypothetical protein [Lysinibacillus capsici]
MNKYVIPIILIILGIIMSTNLLFTTNEYVVSCLNLCAFLFTISCINIGSVKSKRKNNVSKVISIILQVLAVSVFLLTIMDSKAKYYNDVYNFVTKINANSLLLIGLSATLISIYASRDYSENKQNDIDKQMKSLKREIKILENKYLDLKNKNIHLTSQKEKLLSQNRELQNALKEAMNSLKKDG